MAAEPKRNPIERLLHAFDMFQQRHKSVGFPFAIIKKYGEDEGGYQAALIAYYGFLSLFPLLIVATAVLKIVSNDNPELQAKFIESATSYFPAIGNTLADSINSPSRSGIALVIGLLITFYGARGVADAVIHALNHAWAVPRNKRLGFPKSVLRSTGILIGGGVGLILSATITSYATGGNHGFLVRSGLWFVGFAVLYSVIWALFTFGSSARKRPFSNVPGALFLAAGMTVLQSVGVFVVTRQLDSQNGLNAQFAVVLALLFWMYLQAQLFLYAIELNTVRTLRLWPRSLDNKPPTKADRTVYQLYQERETFHVDEPVKH